MFLQQFTYMCMTLSIKVSLMKGEVYWALSEQLPKCIGAQWVTLTLSLGYSTERQSVLSLAWTSPKVYYSRSEHSLNISKGMMWSYAGWPVGRYYRPLVDNRPFCLNGRYSWICGRYCIKMVDISSKSLRMVIDFPYYLKYDKSQDLKVYYSAIKWRNMKISTILMQYRPQLQEYRPFKQNGLLSTNGR